MQDRSGARGDAELVDLWLRGKRSHHTRRAYASDAGSFLAYLGGGGLRTATVRDLQLWADELSGSAGTRARKVSAVKSLLSFGNKTGYLQFNVGTAVQAPRVPNTLAERILDEDEVRALVGAAKSSRDAMLLRLLYALGARRAELCDLCWRHVHWAVITIHGKGERTRHVRIPDELAEELVAFRAGAGEDAPVFATRSGRPIHPDNLAKMVRRAARRADLQRRATPHWLRHANASHALDHGAPISVVQASLGHASLATTGKYVHAKPSDGASLYLPKV